VKLPPLPALATLPALQAALTDGHAVLTAPPGSGKTTVVPLALLDESWLGSKKILILEPRRLAARAAAARMASLLGEPVGQTVGYQIRFDRRIGPATRIEVLTEGILTRRLQTDTDLEDVGLIIFDEFHERSIHADLALALCLDLCQLKADLHLLVMSATLDAQPLAHLLGNVPILSGTGQQHEVRISYLERSPRGRIAQVTTSGIRRALAEEQGDILTFLPGSGEIRQVQSLLNDDLSGRELIIAPLYGDLSQQQQDRAILPDPGGRRRIILATSIAETSLTIEGVGCVVDSGWSRLPAFDPGTGLSALTTVRVSKAAADQRAGRAGRLGPGSCLRLWTHAEHHSLPPFHPPEIVSVDLASLALELALWGVADPSELRWLDPPRPGPFRQAQELLRSLAALDVNGRITATGRQLAALPLHPRLGHLLLTAQTIGQQSLACDLAALLSERDLVRQPVTASLNDRLDLLTTWRRNGDAQVRSEGGDPQSCRRIDQTSRQWLRQLGGTSAPHDPAVVGSLLAAAYPDRIACRRAGQREHYQLASGRGASLAAGDPLTGSDYLVSGKAESFWQRLWKSTPCGNTTAIC
jgi:ATP-dependent helicase HrpB